MAIIPYPSWLPLAQRASKNLTFQTPFRQDVPAVGTPIFQKLTTDISSQWSLTWKFTLAEERAFIQWLRSSRYLNKCNNWFTMMIDLGGSGLQEQTLHFTDYPVQTSIDGGVVTWTGNVIAKKLNNTMDEFDDVLVELDYRWYSWLDEVVNRELPQVYMTPILHMPINMLSSTLDSRIVYDGPQIYYINRNGNLVQSAVNEWPLTFIDGVAVGRVPPENIRVNFAVNNADISSAAWMKINMSVSEYDTITGGYALIPTTTKGAHNLNQTVTNTTHQVGSLVTVSYMVKANGYDFFRVRVADSLGFLGDVVINSTSGEVVSGGSGSTVQNLGGGLFRVTETVTIRAGGTTSILMQCFVDADGLKSTYPGDGVSGAVILLPQIEKSAIATSPIVTESSAVTRPSASAKVAMNGATSIDITYSDGTVVNVEAIGDYATIPRSDSAWGSKYITTIKFNV